MARRLAWGLVIVLVIARFDFWLWDDPRLVLGFLPIGLAYHIGISIAAAVAWALVNRFAWPKHLEEWAEAADSGEDDA